MRYGRVTATISSEAEPASIRPSGTCKGVQRTVPTRTILIPQPPIMSDSNLRQRQQSPVRHAKIPPGKKRSSGGPPTTFANNVIPAALSAFALSVIAFLYLGNPHPSSQPTNSTSESYILCSPPGTQQIYTVDHEDSKVECMAVGGDFIVDTGTHGMLLEPIIRFKTQFEDHFHSQPHKSIFIIQTNLHQARCNCRSRIDR